MKEDNVGSVQDSRDGVTSLAKEAVGEGEQ